MSQPEHGRQGKVSLPTGFYLLLLMLLLPLNNVPKVIVDEQHDNLKHLKEQFDIDPEYEIQNITAAMTFTKKEHVFEKSSQKMFF